jgi:methylmalonyl-CoA mutase C-terminal domain/subunit
MTLFPRVQELLAEAGADHVLLTGGGIIPEDDVRALEARGIGRLFGPGTPTTTAIAYIREWFATSQKAS